MLAGKRARVGGGLRQRWLGGALAPVTSAGLQQRSARHRHGRHRGQYTAVRWQPRTTPARHSQLASLLPRAVLTRDSSQTPFNTAKNQFNQQRENRSGEMRVRECGLKGKQSKREGPWCSLSPLASHSGDFVAHFSTKGEVEQ